MPISGEEPPLAPFGSVFWFRVRALDLLFRKGKAGTGWQHADFPPEPLPGDGTISHAIERVYPFVAQASGYYPAEVMSTEFAVSRCDAMQAYASGMIRPLARVFDCTTFGNAALSATDFAAKRHFGLFRVYGPYSNTRRRRARNWLRDHMSRDAYLKMMKAKRAVFGPHGAPLED